MKIEKLLLVSSLLSFSCGDSHSSKSSPPPSPAPLPKPILTPAPSTDDGKGELPQRYQYRPSWLSSEWPEDEFFVSGQELGFGPAGIFPGEEDIADSMYRYWEAIRTNWKTSLETGVPPKAYLQKVKGAPDIEQIRWTDESKGDVKGFEKLKPIIQELSKRCPSIMEERFKAPLEVSWLPKDHPLKPGGAFVSNKLSLSWNDKTKKIELEANSNLRPLILIRGYRVNSKGEVIYEYPRQTFKEQTDGKSYADEGFALFSIDQTFAHEYGHFLFHALSLNEGRSEFASQMFSEYFAEIFRTLCWGGFQDNKKWIENQRSDFDDYSIKNWIKTYQEAPSRVQDNNYSLWSFDQFLTWEALNDRYDTSKIFNAVITTILQMKGQTLTNYPAYSWFDNELLIDSPWAYQYRDAPPEVRRDAPVIHTRQEFLEKFCNNYPCDPKIKQLMDAEVEGLIVDNDEW